MIFIVVYLLCSAFAYKIFSERLILISRDTGEQIEPHGGLKVLHELAKICFSLSWIISMPVCIITSKLRV